MWVVVTVTRDLMSAAAARGSVMCFLFGPVRLLHFFTFELNCFFFQLYF